MTPANDNPLAVDRARGAGRTVLFAMAAGAVVAGAVLAGLAVIASPWQVRQHVLDRTRVQTLSTISQAIESYHMINGQLPATLTDLLASPQTSPRGLEATGLAGIDYQPEVADAGHYRLCATFLLPAEPGDDYYTERWPHAAGQACFALKVSAK